MCESNETLQEFVNRRWEKNRPTTVHVVGDLSREPVQGEDVARHVADLLVDTDGAVRDLEHWDDLEDGDVAFLTIDKVPPRANEKREQLRKLAAISRRETLAGIVVFADEITQRTGRYVDARVRATSGDVESVERLRISPYDHETFTTPLDGLGDGMEVSP